MAALTTKVLSDDGSAPVLATPTASDTAQVGNGHNTFLYVSNTGGSAASATITPPGTTTYGVALPAKTVSVPGGEAKYIPLRREYADETGRATIAFTGTLADLKVAVVRVA